MPRKIMGIRTDISGRILTEMADMEMDEDFEVILVASPKSPRLPDRGIMTRGLEPGEITPVVKEKR